MRDAFFPKPPPPPEQAFGPLPSVTFPQSQSNGISYTINTIDGTLPILPSRTNVYKIISENPSLLALDEAKNNLDSANFVENQIKLTDTRYRWTQARSGVVIEYDIVNNNFSISSNYLSNSSLLSTGILPDEKSITSDVEGFLRTIQARTENLNISEAKVEYLELTNGKLVGAQNLGSARLARVTILQRPINDIDIVFSNPEGSLTTFVVSYPNSRLQILEGIYYNYIINEEEFSDYPLKTATVAFDNLQKGLAFVDNPQNLSNVDITGIELKYYLDQDHEGYLMPVFVFTGANFRAYVEAIAENTPSTDSSGLGEEQIQPSE